MSTGLPKYNNGDEVDRRKKNAFLFVRSIQLLKTSRELVLFDNKFCGEDNLFGIEAGNGIGCASTSIMLICV